FSTSCPYLSSGLFQALESFFPEFQAGSRDGIANLCGHSGSCLPLFYSGPWKKCKDAARTPHLITKIEMIGLGIIKIHGLLHHPQSKDLRVKIEVPLSLSCNGSDVVKSQYPIFHDQLMLVL